MKLIFIYGLPATGKLTVAQELASLTGYRLFHNHLVVDCLLPVFEFGSESFVALREEFWLSIFDHACRSRLPALIFTYAPERSVRPGFVQRATEVMHQGGLEGGEVDFVELTCPLAELKDRLASPSRLRHQKLTSLPLFERLLEEGAFDTSSMPGPGLTLDTSLCTAKEAALQIIEKLELTLASP